MNKLNLVFVMFMSFSMKIAFSFDVPCDENVLWDRKKTLRSEESYLIDAYCNRAHPFYFKPQVAEQMIVIEKEIDAINDTLHQLKKDRISRGCPTDADLLD